VNLAQHIPTSVLKVVGRKALIVRKHSPEILFGAGVVGAVTSTVLACKATLKLENILNGAHDTIDQIDAVEERPDYTDRDRQKDKITVKVQTAMKITKNYAPAIGVGILSVGALTGSHYIMSSRQAGLMAAYAALEKGYQEYQNRVRDELGVEREEQLRYGSVMTKVKDEEGKSVKVHRVDPNAHSVYARFFDETAKEWVRTPEYNLVTLRCQQNRMNDMLHAQGHLFLNEVYDALGIERSKAGAVVGWIVSKDSDNFVDFGIFNGENPAVRDFVNGHEGSIFLDFNVDGVIYDKI
jgi:uncharacterized protein DUF6353